MKLIYSIIFILLNGITIYPIKDKIEPATAFEIWLFCLSIVTFTISVIPLSSWLSNKFFKNDQPHGYINITFII